MGPLFDKSTLANKTFLTEVVDICARKHNGNEQSISAFHVIKDKITAGQERIMYYIRQSPDGITLDAIAQFMDVPPNAISGRVSELKRMGKIYKSGTRKTRSGCSAAILKAFD